MKVLIIDNLGYNILYKTSLLLLPHRFGIMRSWLKKSNIESDFLDIGMKIQKEYIKNNITIESKDNIKFLRKILEESELNSYSYLIISATIMRMPSSSFDEVITVLKEIRNRYKGTIIIGGGITYGEYLFGHRYIDQNIVNEVLKYSEYIIVNKDFEAVNRIINKTFGYNIISKTISLVPKELDGNINNTIENEECDLDGINLEDYSYSLKEILESSKFSTDKIPNDNTKVSIMPFRFNMGCKFKCAYCAMKRYETYFDVDNLVDKIAKLKQKYGISNFLFVNNYVNFDKKYLVDFCNKIIERKLDIQWSDSIRISKYDKEMYSLLRKSGCVRLTFGVDTINDRMQKYVHKIYSLENIENALNWSHENGIWNSLSFIYGFPYEKKSEIISNFNYPLQKIKTNVINQFNFNLFSLLPYSPMFENPKEYGLIIKNKETLIELKSNSFDTIGFDEINGIDFEERKKRNWEIFKTLKNKIKNLENKNTAFALLNDQQSHLIYYLEKRFKNKQKGIEFLNNLKIIERKWDYELD